MPRSLSLKYLYKTVRQMHSSRSPQHARSVVGIAITANHGIAQAMTSSLSWKPSGFVPGNWNLVPGKQQWELEFPFQNSHSKSNMCLWLSSLPWRASSALSCGHRGHCWRGSVPLKPDRIWSLRKVLLSFVLFLIFTLGHFFFSRRRGKRIHPGRWSQLLTIHYT